MQNLISSNLQRTPTWKNPAAALRPEAVLRAILRPGAPAPRGTAPASPAAAAATAADVAAADGGGSHDKPAATVPAPATAAPTDDDASATTVDDGAHADHSTSDDTAAQLCYPGTLGVRMYCVTSFFHLPYHHSSARSSIFSIYRETLIIRQYPLSNFSQQSNAPPPTILQTPRPPFPANLSSLEPLPPAVAVVNPPQPQV